MKIFITFVVSIFLIGTTEMALAQTKTPVVGKPAVSAVASQPLGNPAIHNVNLRLRQDMMQIQKDLHAGKLTKAQATTLQAKVKAIRSQELGFMKSNGNPSSGSSNPSGRSGKQLTDDQTAQLNQSLGQLEPTL